MSCGSSGIVNDIRFHAFGKNAKIRIFLFDRVVFPYHAIVYYEIDDRVYRLFFSVTDNKTAKIITTTTEISNILKTPNI